MCVRCLKYLYGVWRLNISGGFSDTLRWGEFSQCSLLHVCTLLCLETFLTVSTWKQEFKIGCRWHCWTASYSPVRRSVHLALRTVCWLQLCTRNFKPHICRTVTVGCHFTAYSQLLLCDAAWKLEQSSARVEQQVHRAFVTAYIFWYKATANSFFRRAKEREIPCCRCLRWYEYRRSWFYSI